MKLSLDSEYALLSLIHLARLTKGEALTLEAIAAAQHTPAERLAELLGVLIQNGYLNGQRGPYQLARSAGEISVAEIIRLSDGALAPLEPVSDTGCWPAHMDQEEKLVELFGELQVQIVDRLEGTSLAELV